MITLREAMLNDLLVIFHQAAEGSWRLFSPTSLLN